MTDEAIPVEGLKLVDTEGKPLDIRQVRGKMSGDIFIGHDLDSLPAQGAPFVATIVGKVKGGYKLDQQKGGDWILTATLDVDERRSFQIVEEEEPNLFEDRWQAIIDELDDELPVFSVQDLEAAAADAQEAGWTTVGFARVMRGAASLTGMDAVDAVRLQIQLDAGDVVEVPDAEREPEQV